LISQTNIGILRTKFASLEQPTNGSCISNDLAQRKWEKAEKEIKELK